MGERKGVPVRGRRWRRPSGLQRFAWTSCGRHSNMGNAGIETDTHTGAHLDRRQRDGVPVQPNSLEIWRRLTSKLAGGRSTLLMKGWRKGLQRRKGSSYSESALARLELRRRSEGSPLRRVRIATIAMYSAGDGAGALMTALYRTINIQWWVLRF